MSDATRRRMKIAARQALSAWGHASQIHKAAEEAVELANALLHYKGDARGYEPDARFWNVIDEIADCEIMLCQLRLMFNGDGKVDERVLSKLKRLEGLLVEVEARHDAAVFADAPAMAYPMDVPNAD